MTPVNLSGLPHLPGVPHLHVLPNSEKGERLEIFARALLPILPILYFLQLFLLLPENR